MRKVPASRCTLLPGPAATAASKAAWMFSVSSTPVGDTVNIGPLSFDKLTLFSVVGLRGSLFVQANKNVNVKEARSRYLNFLCFIVLSSFFNFDNIMLDFRKRLAVPIFDMFSESMVCLST
jgi:hypothetical protein